METQKQKLMRILKISEQEAEDVMECDRRIDKGEKLFSLTPEQEKEVRKYRQAPRAANTTPIKRERKENPTKAGIIAELASFLNEHSEFAIAGLEITNKERQIKFSIGDQSFELTLVQKRAAKK